MVVYTPNVKNTYLIKSHFGFRNGLGTREVLFELNVLVRRYWNVSEDEFAVSYILEKISIE